MEDRQAKLVRVAQVARVFSPGAPIDKYRLFAGRIEQVREVINAINQRGQHVVLFGERGVGKTSLANVLSDILSDTDVRGLDSGTINCDSTDDFSSLWHKIFREIQVVVNGTSADESGDDHLPELARLNEWLDRQVTPDDIRYFLRSFQNPTTIIIDEVDRIKDAQTTGLLADTIKNLSDHSVDTTLILVGVADSVDQLISQHQSVERSLLQVRMPRMSMDELFEILDKGLGQLGIGIDPKAKYRIAALSDGLPHYTHLLGLDATQRAILDDRDSVIMSDVDAAVGRAVEKAQQSIRSAYHKATSSPRRDTLYARVLLACALAATDDLGYFSASDVKEPMSTIMGRPYDIPAFSRHLNDFTETQHGRVLEKTGTARRFRFRFVNPMMQPYIILHGLAKGLLTLESLKDLQPEKEPPLDFR